MLQTLLPLLTTVFDRVLPDTEQRDAAKLKLMEITSNGELSKLTASTELAKGQMEVNRAEAQAPDFFTRGWRPATGWTCNLGLFYQFIFRPIAVGLGYPMPALETDTLLTLLFGILGLGAYRTTEKIKGVSR